MGDKMPLAGDLDWQHLKGFYYVAKLGNFTKAAESVFRTQSALSQQIKALEQHLGYRLFERTGQQSVLLTREGETLLTFTEDLLERQIRLLQDIESIQDANRGRVRLGAAPTIAHGVLPDLLADFKKAYPAITVSVYARMPGEIIDMVKSGFLDLGMTLESMIPHTLTRHKWRINRFWLMAPPDHPLVTTKPLTLKDIFRYPVIVTSNSKFAARRRFEFEAERMGFALNIVLESNSAFMSAEYVKRGLGVCFMSMPEEVSKVLASQLAFLPLDAYFEPEYIYLYHRQVEVVGPVRTFLHIMTQGSREQE